MNVVITQSMLFPWVGMLEQLRLADIIIHYDDVQFSKGSFTNRVQLKTPEGKSWLTIPLLKFRFGQLIDEVIPQDSSLWCPRHLALLRQSFQTSPYATDAIEIAKQVYSEAHQNISGFARSSMLSLANYYGLLNGKSIIDVRDLNIGGLSSDRVLDVVSAVGGNVYITGHGARHYLNHTHFEEKGIEVRYMRYEARPYPQSWGAFTPYVTGLDLVAHCGKEGIQSICSEAIPWRDFLSSSSAEKFS